jgi:hypothetical protein
VRIITIRMYPLMGGCASNPSLCITSTGEWFSTQNRAQLGNTGGGCLVGSMSVGGKGGVI